MRAHRIATAVGLALTTAALLAGCQKEASDQMAADSAGMSSMQMEAGGAGQGGLAALIGTFQSVGEGNTITVQENGSFTVSQGDSVAVHGQMTASGDTVTITDDYCDGPGVYIVHAGTSGPVFTAISDECQDRKADLAGDTTAMSDTM
jgi:hypothetical protein